MPPAIVKVSIDGQVITQDNWHLANNHIVIENPWCDALAQGAAQSITISTDCHDVVAP